MHEYLQLLERVVDVGDDRPSRVGMTRSVFGASFSTTCLAHGYFPLLTTRRVYTKGVLGELAAFLKGADKLQDFKDFGCNYWDHNAMQWGPNKKLPPEKMTVGRIYGVQWRDWNYEHDQLRELVKGIKHDPYGRRHILTTWNPSELHEMCLPPCHILAQFYVDSTGGLSVNVYMRSVDLCLGLPSDIILYAALLLLVAKETDLKPYKLSFAFGDAHIYHPHFANLTVQLNRHPGKLPTYTLAPEASLFDFKPEQLTINNYQPQEPLHYELF